MGDASALALDIRDLHVHYGESHALQGISLTLDTVLHNLALFCTRHHHRLHHPDWQVRLDGGDATITITTPAGRVLTSRPPPILSQLSFADTG